MIVRLLVGVAVAGTAAILVVAHELGSYMDDVYDHEEWWGGREE